VKKKKENIKHRMRNPAPPAHPKAVSALRSATALQDARALIHAAGDALRKCL
jgi:hypothetical protein